MPGSVGAVAPGRAGSVRLARVEGVPRSLEPCRISFFFLINICNLLIVSDIYLMYVNMLIDRDR